ncbi:type II toxin-antitoxin system RelB/DinJ family antitoxin [Moraxella bovis]|uniref:type II toxin-antitoxin system RelB/DinJ family antitoxin n=1 Tax=Moraxella bovis TaxID=476 RepID=UPI0022275714|nr:type II toxin-antitoxin system RelB/DinJ family antitoxin [Moraxella bovis]UZA24279.1 type II toxin-antitoxin system RelB/DinJ family antitoxin [Moraxella bovis]UZA30532.1 type II toxin-antitoxin system RelB/DinJ family antitoxin [Moraxella bovis]
MSRTNFNMRLDNDLRQKAYPVLEQYGLTPSQAVRMFFNQIAQTGKVPLSFDWGQSHTLSSNGEKLLRESIQAFENGETERFDSLDELNQAMAEIARG